jgi:hypothetical protein
MGEDGNISPLNCGRACLLVHEEPEVPDFVRLIRINLPDDREFLIRSEAR